MAKKRVHEIAKERGISSKEVIATLQKAGFDVKAAAQSIDERDIAQAFNGGGGDGAAEAGDRGPETGAPAQAAPRAQQDGGDSPAATPRPATQSERPQRPQRPAPPRDGGGGGGRRRRVVIDSQASRRPQGPPPPQQPPRRGRGR